MTVTFGVALIICIVMLVLVFLASAFGLLTERTKRQRQRDRWQRKDRSER